MAAAFQPFSLFKLRLSALSVGGGGGGECVWDYGGLYSSSIKDYDVFVLVPDKGLRCVCASPR